MRHNLSEEQKECFETLGPTGLADCLEDLLYFESEGFADWKVNDLTDIILEAINKARKGEEL